MPRPKKVDTASKEVAKDEGLVTLAHFAESGTMFIDGEAYPIENGYVKVKPEHYAQAREHIKQGG